MCVLFFKFDAIEEDNLSVSALVERTQLDVAEVDKIVCGTVVQESRTSNIAREAALTAGFPKRVCSQFCRKACLLPFFLQVPCHTVTLACISSNMAVANIVDSLKVGQGEVAIAGGVEFLTDVPIRYNRIVSRHSRVQQSARVQMKHKTPTFRRERQCAIFKKPKRCPKSCDSAARWSRSFSRPNCRRSPSSRAARRWGRAQIGWRRRLACLGGMFFCSLFIFENDISRCFSEQDEFALRSHSLAEKATKDGHLKDLAPFFVPRGKKQTTISTDNTVRITPMDKLEKLKPAFIRPYGTITAGESTRTLDESTTRLSRQRLAAHRRRVGRPHRYGGVR